MPSPDIIRDTVPMTLRETLVEALDGIRDTAALGGRRLETAPGACDEIEANAKKALALLRSLPEPGELSKTCRARAAYHRQMGAAEGRTGIADPHTSSAVRFEAVADTLDLLQAELAEMRRERDALHGIVVECAPHRLSEASDA
jgi:hypothetical protein